MNRLSSVESDTDDVRTTSFTSWWDNCVGYVYCCAQGIRRRVGMTSIQAIVWNVGGSDMQVYLSVGVAHSSDEALVMGVERRGDHVREDDRINGVNRRSA